MWQLTGVKMPLQIEHDGKEITVYTKDDLDREVAGLKITNQQLKDEKKDLAEKLSGIAEEKRKAEEEKAKRDGDYEKLNQLMAERQQESAEKYSALIGQIKREKVQNAVSSLVTELGAGGEANEDLRDLLRTRFEFDFNNESGAVTVSGDGVATLDELRNVIKTSGRYDRYLAGSRASGGSAVGSNSSGAAGKKFNELTGAELVNLRRENPAEYERLRKEFHGT